MHNLPFEVEELSALWPEQQRPAFSARTVDQQKGGLRGGNGRPGRLRSVGERQRRAGVAEAQQLRRLLLQRHAPQQPHLHEAGVRSTDGGARPKSAEENTCDCGCCLCACSSGAHTPQHDSKPLVMRA